MAHININDQEYVIIGREVFLSYPCQTGASVVEHFPEISQKKDKEEICEEAEKPAKVPATEVKNHVLCCAFSECGNLIAIADDIKRLMVWKKDDLSWKILFTRCSARKCVKVKFSPSGKHLLAADRSGDVYLFSVEEEIDSGCLLLGHLSMLLDMIVSPDEKYVITCDRDEKIRVSHFPNAYNIHNYCLGHTEFVSCIVICGYNKEYLLSGSGDGTLRLWKYLEGKELFSLYYSTILNIKRDNPTEDKSDKPPLVRIMSVSGQSVAVLFDGVAGASLFKLKSKADYPELLHLQNLPFETELWDIAFQGCNKLFALAPIESQTVLIYTARDLDEENEKWTVDYESNHTKFSAAVNSIWNDLKELVGIKSCFQNLYKQWYDNVKIYMEKKKLRQEEKFKKLKITL